MENIFDYLLDLLVDAFEIYLTFAQDFNLDDSRKNLSEENKAAYNKFIFAANGEIMCEEQVLDTFYANLISFESELAYPLKRIISFLVGRYVMFCYNDDDKVLQMAFFSLASADEVLEKFKENYYFAIDLISTAFKSFLNEKKVYENIAYALANNESYSINKWLADENDEIEASLNEELRNSICNMVDKLVQDGVKYQDALDYVWQFFTRNFDPTGIISKYGDEKKPEFIKQEILNIMYSDVFEDACNRHDLDKLDYEERFMMMTVILSVYSGAINVPSEQIRKDFLARFIDLRYDYEKRKKNRCASYENGNINLVKKVNPSYQYDELTF